MPMVSVIIPTYNRVGTIVKSINSVLNQTYSDFEIIVVDDCSTDNTLSEVRKISDGRIKIISHEVNKGASAARNTGINNATGKYIAFQDSDDEWLTEKLEKQMYAIRENKINADIIYSSFERRINNEFIEVIPVSNKPLTGNICYTLASSNVVGPPTVLIRREILRNIKFNENLKALEDWDFFLKLAKHNVFLFLNEVLVITNVSENSISSHQVNDAESLYKVLIDNKSIFVNSGGDYYRWIRESAIRNILSGNKVLARHIIKNHMFSNNKFHMALSLLGLSFLPNWIAYKIINKARDYKNRRVSTQ